MGVERHKQENQARESEVWRLRVRGATQAEVAAAVGISQQAVSKILKKVGDRHAREFVEEMRAQKAEQTARLDQLYEDATDQWRRSCEDARRVNVTAGRVQRTADGPVSLPELIVTTTERQTGDPALLGRAMEALAGIRKLWGLESALRSEVSGPAGGPVRIVEIDADGIGESLDAKLSRLVQKIRQDGGEVPAEPTE